MTPSTRDFLDAALRDAGVTARLDARGLMPLDEARQRVAQARAFERGEGVEIDGAFVLDSDLLWAALLSLEDADAFVAAARRLEWRFHVRGFDNIAPYERYGAGIFAWIEERIDAAGCLRNVPWCLLPCILASPAPEAWALARAVRRVDERLDSGHTGPRQGVEPLWTLRRWLVAWPDPGWTLLATGAAAGGEAERALLEALSGEDPTGTWRALVDAAGRDAAQRLYAAVGAALPREEAEPCIAQAALVEIPSGPRVALSALDPHFRDFQAPAWDNCNFFCAAMRVHGFVHAEGDALLFQSLVTGLGEGNLRVEVAAFGPTLRSGLRWELGVELVGEGALVGWDGAACIHRLTGVRVEGRGRLAPPGGPLRHVQLDVRGHAVALDLDALEPDLRAAYGPEEAALILLGRHHADAAFIPAAELARRVGLPDGAVELFRFDRWEHPPSGEPASGSDDLRAMIEALALRRAITTLPIGDDVDEPARARLESVGGWGSQEAWG